MYSVVLENLSSICQYGKQRFDTAWVKLYNAHGNIYILPSKPIEQHTLTWSRQTAMEICNLRYKVSSVDS